MTITTVGGRILQSLEFWRSGYGRYFVHAWNNVVRFKVLLLPFFILFLIRFFIHMFGVLCRSLREAFQVVQTNASQHGVVSGGLDILEIANQFLPIDEIVALFLVWGAVYTACCTIRFIRSAWETIPLKAT